MTIALLAVLFALLVAIGMPISFAIGVAAMFGTLVLPDVDNATIVQRMLTSVNTFPLLAVIFFIFAGQLMARGGVAMRLVRLAEVLVGRLPGGLAHIVIVSSMFFGGVTGSAVAEVSSIGMIVFAHVAGNVSIAALFLAGVVPGVLIGLSLMVAAFIHGRLYHQQATPPMAMREKIRRVFDGLAGIMTIVIILGGIVSGVFTATEAGAAASVYALILTVFVYKEIKLRDLPEIMWECCVTNAVVMMLIATSSVYSWILTYERLPQLLADNVFNIIDGRVEFLLILNVFLLIVGMLIDMTPALIMLVPILLPLALKFGIDFVHLGLIVIVNLSFGLITPPVGTALFVGVKIAKIPMEKVIPPMLPLLACMIAVLLFVTYFPQVFMWIPRGAGFVK